MSHRGYQRLVAQPDYEAILLEGPSFLGSDLPEVIVEPAPMLGEHTRSIAARLLGLGRPHPGATEGVEPHVIREGAGRHHGLANGHCA